MEETVANPPGRADLLRYARDASIGELEQSGVVERSANGKRLRVVDPEALARLAASPA
ncbi:MAG TPA: hypothetical protein VFA86_06715 [Gammaproteobacteria bacterium]|nr:hypothetical protein [Gammaproteobacteria bacterium]